MEPVLLVAFEKKCQWRKSNLSDVPAAYSRHEAQRRNERIMLIKRFTGWYWTIEEMIQTGLAHSGVLPAPIHLNSHELVLLQYNAT